MNLPPPRSVFLTLAFLIGLRRSPSPKRSPRSNRSRSTRRSSCHHFWSQEEQQSGILRFADAGRRAAAGRTSRISVRRFRSSRKSSSTISASRASRISSNIPRAPRSPASRAISPARPMAAAARPTRATHAEIPMARLAAARSVRARPRAQFFQDRHPVRLVQHRSDRHQSGRELVSLRPRFSVGPHQHRPRQGAGSAIPTS